MLGDVHAPGPRPGAGWDPLEPDGVPLVPVATPEMEAPDLASVYALTKYTQERLTLTVAPAYGMEGVALRLFNVYGPGQALSNPYTGVLAIFASRLLHRERPMVFEDGEQRRDFVHVDDVAQAFMLALEHPQAAGQAFNIGSGPGCQHPPGRRRDRPRHGAAASAGRSWWARRAPATCGTASATSPCAAACWASRPRRTFDDSLGELVEWVRRQQAVDLVSRARQELEQRGLVA